MSRAPSRAGPRCAWAATIATRELARRHGLVRLVIHPGDPTPVVQVAHRAQKNRKSADTGGLGRGDKPSDIDGLRHDRGVQ